MQESAVTQKEGQPKALLLLGYLGSTMQLSNSALLHAGGRHAVTLRIRFDVMCAPGSPRLHLKSLKARLQRPQALDLRSHACIRMQIVPGMRMMPQVNDTQYAQRLKAPLVPAHSD